MGTAIVLVMLAAAVFFAVRSLLRDKRDGKSTFCGGDCRSCSGCHH